MKNYIQISLTANILLLTSTCFAQDPVFPPLEPFPQTTGQEPAQAPANPLNTYAQMPQQNTLNSQNNARQTSKPFREFSGYLGIELDVLPSAVSAQLPKGLTTGVLVKGFSQDSPAAASDLKPYDVMVAYDNTTLSHPEQFIKIVRDDIPGRVVNMKVVRRGQVLDIPVTIGAQKTPDPKEFNGLAIKQISKNKYRAIVRFIGPNGNKQERSYEGDRDEIFQQAINATDLPQPEREQLLYATRPRQQNNNSGFGSFFPFGNNNNSGGGDWMNPRKYFKW